MKWKGQVIILPSILTADYWAFSYVLASLLHALHILSLMLITTMQYKYYYLNFYSWVNEGLESLSHLPKAIYLGKNMCLNLNLRSVWYQLHCILLTAWKEERKEMKREKAVTSTWHRSFPTITLRLGLPENKLK